MADIRDDDPHMVDPQVGEQAQGQTGQRRLRIRIDESDVDSSYTNAFRTNRSAEEVVIDFGVNTVNALPQNEGKEDQPVGEIRFKVTDRIIMNYYTAKRLAISLSNTVRSFEQRFGELKLNAADRVIDVGGKK